MRVLQLFRQLCLWPACGAVWVLFCSAATLEARAKTDVVMLANGNRVAGEVKALSRGRLELSTDDAGTLYLEWDKLVTVVAARQFEVVTRDGRRFLGQLAAADPRHINVASPVGPVSLPMSDVTIVREIGQGFWNQLDGSIDVGFSYTRSSGVAQLNLNSEHCLREAGVPGPLAVSLTQTQTDDGSGRDDRGSLRVVLPAVSLAGVVHQRRRPTRDQREPRPRASLPESASAVGPRLINSNRAQLMSAAQAVAVNDERGVDVASAQNVRGAVGISTAGLHVRPSQDQPRHRARR